MEAGCPDSHRLLSSCRSLSVPTVPSLEGQEYRKPAGTPRGSLESTSERTANLRLGQREERHGYSRRTGTKALRSMRGRNSRLVACRVSKPGQERPRLAPHE